MLKPIAAIILSLSLIFLFQECIVSLRSGNIPAPPGVEEKKQAKPQAASQAEKNVIFYPPVPATLPDLNKGYLFNEERTLEGEAETAGTDEGEEAGAGLAVDMDTVFYAGSIIFGDTRKGLVTFPAAPTAARKAARTGKPGPVLAPEAPQKQKNYLQLGVGESFSGYKVTAVEPDRIVFQKGAETVEKLLSDAKKIRIAPPAPQPAAQEKQKTPEAKTAKTNRVQLDKAKTTARPVQSAKPVQSSRPGGSLTRTVPGGRIQVPGVPAQTPAPAPVPAPAPAPASPPTGTEPPEEDTTN